MKKLLVYRKKGKHFAKDMLMLDSQELKALTNERNIRIIGLLSKKSMYPAQIAKELGIYTQKVYYNISQLEEAGIISVVKEDMIKGGKAKYYGLACGAFGIDMDKNERQISEIKAMPEELMRFFSPIGEGGAFNGRIVVGSPDPHGPFNTGARDGHYSAHLGFFLGNYMDPQNFSVRLDIDMKAENRLGNNMILLGGPGVNTISYQCNRKFPYFFNIKSSKYGFLMGGLVSKKTNEVYTDPKIGVIQKIRNPWDKEKTIIMLAGTKAIGTKASIIALTKGHEKILSGYKGGDMGVLVRGLDLDGDGKVDSVEVVED